MSAYGKVTYTENDEASSEVLKENFESDSVVEQQVNKFDSSYSMDKLQELYNEYDSITLDEEKIKSITQVKTNVVNSKVSFRMALCMTTTVVVALLMAFLCIYNIFVINQMGGNITYLQEEVASYEYALTQAEGIYNSLTNTDNIQSELNKMGYSDVASSNMVAVDVADKVSVVTLEGETNWFDSVCNFLSQIFG